LNRRPLLIKALKMAFPRTLPVLAGFAFLGIAYGVLMSTKGYGAVWSFLMSAAAFCGSMQFVAITLLTSAFNPWLALALTLIVNARHLFYGISLLDRYKGLGKLKPFLIFTLCDETFSLVCNTDVPEGVNRGVFYFFISLLDYGYWVVGSLAGGLIGSLIQIRIEGLDFVLTALFAVIFLDQWEKRRNRPAAAVGVAGAIFCLVIFGPDRFMIPALLTIILTLYLGRQKFDKRQMEEVRKS